MSAFEILAIDRSLSARRAWIEISMGVASNFKHPVALRKESVDRNHLDDVDGGDLVQSLSARRAWIEISCRLNQSVSAQWSLSARRAWIEMYLTILKIYATLSLSARRAWIEIPVKTQKCQNL